LIVFIAAQGCRSHEGGSEGFYLVRVEDSVTGEIVYDEIDSEGSPGGA